MKTLFLSGAVKSLPTWRIDILKSQRHLLSLPHLDGEDARKQSLGELHERRKQDPASSESRKVMTRELTWPPRPILAEYLAKRLPWSQRHRSARRAAAVPRRRKYAERKANMRAERRLSKNFAFPAYNSFPTYN